MCSLSRERLPENTVEYFLYPCIEDLSSGTVDVKNKLNDLVVKYSGHLAHNLANYIWHKDPFVLYILN